MFATWSRTPTYCTTPASRSRRRTTSPSRGSRRTTSARKDGTREGFAAITGDGEFVGIGLAPAIERTDEEIELGYIVPAWARGRGVASEILRLLTVWAFGDVGAMRRTWSSTSRTVPRSGWPSAAGTYERE